MDTITIGFSRPKKFKPFAWLIMKGYGINYDHVYIKFHSDKYNRDIIYQASQTMVNFMSNVIFLSDNEVVNEYSMDITADKKTEMIQFAMDNAGIPYGKLQAFGLAIVRIFEVFGKKINNPFGDGIKTFVCCKLAAYILENFAGDVIDEPLNNITPKDLYSYMQNIQKK